MTTLFDDFADKRSIAQRFAEFDAAHPEVYEAFKFFARQLRDAGRERGSAEQIIQRLRWDTSLRAARGEHELKINDHFRTMYARKLATEDSSFKAFFEFRQRRTA